MPKRIEHTRGVEAVLEQAAAQHSDAVAELRPLVDRALEEAEGEVARARARLEVALEERQRLQTLGRLVDAASSGPRRLGRVASSPSPSRAPVDAGAVTHPDGGGDGVDELGEMESLRLQMAMDRLSKMMSTLSNVMKKYAETQQAILDNLK